MGLLHTAAGLLLAAGTVTARRWSPAERAQECCTNMAARYPDNVLLPDSDGYSDANQRWSETAELSPSCIVRPDSADLVSNFLQTMNGGTRLPGTCSFAIKSGGHNPWPGVNDIDTGIVMDLSNINEVSLNYDRTFVKLGAGGTWGDVYKSLEPQGMMAPGARASGVGVGGMILGGGLSYFTPRVGITADNVINFEIVLASGEVANANSDNNTDLFWALKGGSSNFGIVTRIDVKAFENGEIWGGEIVSPINATDDALHHLTEFVANSNEDVNAAVEVVFNLNTTSGAQRIVSIVADTAGDSESSLLKSFQDLPKLADTSRKTTMSDLSEELQSRLPAGQRYAFATVTFQNDLEALRWVHNISLSTFNDYKDIPDVTWNLVYESLPKYYKNFGDNPLGLNYTSGDRIALVLNPTWLDAEHDDHMAEAANDWLARIHEYTNVHGSSSPLELITYSAPFQDPLGSYGASNLQALQEIAKKYDPKEVFQKLAPGDFRVSKAGTGGSN